MTTREYIDEFKKTHGRLPSQVELSRSLKMSPQTALQALIQYTREEPNKTKVEEQKKAYTVTILRGFLVLLSAMAFTLSVYFTGLWFSDRFNLFIAGLISLSMVLFMVIAPQTLRFVKNLFVKSVVILSFLIALFFSMGSTVAGQFNATTALRETTRDVSGIYSNLTENELEIKDLINEAKRDKEVHSRTLEDLSVNRLDNWQEIATERKYIDQFNEKIDRLNADLKGLRDKMETELDNGIIEKRDFYSFIAGLLVLDRGLVEFMVSALPAVFIDVISALCLNLALFIRREE